MEFNGKFHLTSANISFIKWNHALKQIGFEIIFHCYSHFRMKYSDLVPKSRTRKSIQESGAATRGRGVSTGLTRSHANNDGAVRNHSAEISKSSSISNINQIRPRSTSLTRSQSQRLGPGRGHHNTGVSSGGHVTSVTRSSVDRPQSTGQNIVRPRSSTLNSSQKSRGKVDNYHSVMYY